MELPKGIADLGPDAQARVRELVAGAQQAQGEELRAALEHTLRIVPRPLRGVVRKVLS